MKRKVIQQCLDEKQMKWLIKHYAHTKNSDILLRLGISHYKLHIIARELSLKKSTQFMHKCQRAASEAGAAVCYRSGYYDYLRKHPFGDKPHHFEKGKTNEQRWGKKKNQRRIERATESLRETRKKERRRLIFGFEQQTKLHIIFTKQNKARYSFKWRLRKLSYHVERYSFDVFYDCNTKRSDNIEKIGKEKYRLDFKELKQEEQ